MSMKMWFTWRRMEKIKWRYVWEKNRVFLSPKINNSSFPLLYLYILWTSSFVLSSFHDSCLPKFFSLLFRLTSCDTACVDWEVLSIRSFCIFFFPSQFFPRSLVYLYFIYFFFKFHFLEHLGGWVGPTLVFWLRSWFQGAEIELGSVLSVEHA